MRPFATARAGLGRLDKGASSGAYSHRSPRLSIARQHAGSVESSGRIGHGTVMNRLTLALYQPDIAQNTGTMLRTCACLGVMGAIIEPAGFPVSDRHFRRAGMDYLDHVALERHVSWAAFEAWRAQAKRRLVLLTTRTERAYTDFVFADDDILLVGRETAGAPEAVHAVADARIVIPLQPNLRSLNVAVAAAIVISEALRQIGARGEGRDGRE
jgi:tRNA (cytidine/uridine-2'-O-)-methyltransferase